MNPLESSYTYASAGGHPLALVAFPVIGAALLALPQRKRPVDGESRVGKLRRVTAFVTDMSVGIMITLPPIVLISLAVEWATTGAWAWSYERDFVRATDFVFVGLMMTSLVAVGFYFRRQFAAGLMTPGQRLMGFRLVANGENPSISKRAFTAWINIAWWPTWPWTLFGRRRDYWWDNASQIVARRVT